MNLSNASPQNIACYLEVILFEILNIPVWLGGLIFGDLFSSSLQCSSAICNPYSHISAPRKEHFSQISCLPVSCRLLCSDQLLPRTLDRPTRNVCSWKTCYLSSKSIHRFSLPTPRSERFFINWWSYVFELFDRSNLARKLANPSNRRPIEPHQSWLGSGRCGQKTCKRPL